MLPPGASYYVVTPGDGDVAVHGDRSVVGVVHARRVAGGDTRRVRFANPGCDDSVAAEDTVVVWVIPVRDVLGEQRADQVGVIRHPRFDVAR